MILLTEVPPSHFTTQSLSIPPQYCRSRFREFLENPGLLGPSSSLKHIVSEAARLFKKSALSTGCNNYIILLSDGIDTEPVSPEEIKKVAGDDVTVFSYGIGPASHTQHLKDIACDTNGIFQQVRSIMLSACYFLVSQLFRPFIFCFDLDYAYGRPSQA